LSGPGDREAAIRTPLEHLLERVGRELDMVVTPFSEVQDPTRGVRPDYALNVNGTITGYLELKRPGAPVDPAGFSGHNLRQWERQRDFPNLVYTNGTRWLLWQNEQLVAEASLVGGPLEAPHSLRSDGALLDLLVAFFSWEPVPITTVNALVKAVSPLTRLLRSEVLDQLEAEDRAVAAGASEHDQPFTGLAADWRNLLFPTATNEVFADGYAQAVTFALLLARSEALDLSGGPHEIGTRLGGSHSLMGRALQVLTADVGASFAVTLELLIRVVGAIEWEQVRRGRRDTYLHLYEHFLDVYDPELRRQSGSYYTPHEVVDQMVRLTDDALLKHLGKADGFRDHSVLTVDAAMGTGTYLQAIIEHAANQVAKREGPGMMGPTATSVAERLVGFEIQMGPFAVAELRTTDLLHSFEAAMPAGGMRLYVTDTLDDPHIETTQLGSGLEPIAQSRRKANEIKASDHITVVIGNPPYRERAKGLGGWIESGSPVSRAPLDDFRSPGNGRVEYVLKNLYVYFWRWASKKVFDDSAAGAGIVCFISTAGYLRGQGFKGMREYLRRTCSGGYVIDVSPEGIRPDVATRIFPGVQQPLAIGLFFRRSDKDPGVPADIRYRAVTGRRAEKFAAIAEVSLDDDEWRRCRTEWQSPFTPAANSSWDDFPALGDLMPWAAPGVKPNRTWVYAPSPEILAKRWRRLTTETDLEVKRRLFRETDSSNLQRAHPPLPGADTYKFSGTFVNESGDPPAPVRVGYRALDRQWIVPDSRVIHRSSLELWNARAPGQVFVIEQHARQISSGPGIVFSALIPDMDYFKGSEGGRALPLCHPDGSANLATGLLQALATALGVEVSPLDLVAYIAAVVAHPGFTATFLDELVTPGIRVPITLDPELWSRAVELGRQVVWAQTYGEAFADEAAGRPSRDVRFGAGDARRIQLTRTVTEMPTALTYDAERKVLSAGAGEWGPVEAAVMDYAVGGRKVVKSWFDYRKKDPAGRRSSPLDDIHIDSWPGEWSVELTDLLSAVTRLVDLEEPQASLLEAVLAGPLATTTTLVGEGVRWPTTRRDRAVRNTLDDETPGRLLDALPSTYDDQSASLPAEK
jgi:hypothetical protein